MADLVTITAYKGFRGITNTTDDTRLNVIVPSVSNLVKTYCGRSFIDYYSSDKVQEFSIKWPQNVVFLSEIPLVSITSVEEYKNQSEQADYQTLTSTQYEYDTNLDAVYRIEGGARKDFPMGINSVKVTYKGGYSSLPEDLKLAVIDLITYYLKEEHKPEKNHSSFTIRNNNAEPDFPDHIKRVLDLYRDG